MWKDLLKIRLAIFWHTSDAVLRKQFINSHMICRSPLILGLSFLPHNIFQFISYVSVVFDAVENHTKHILANEIEKRREWLIHPAMQFGSGEIHRYIFHLCEKCGKFQSFICSFCLWSLPVGKAFGLEWKRLRWEWGSCSRLLILCFRVDSYWAVAIGLRGYIARFTYALSVERETVFVTNWCLHVHVPV